MEFNFDQEYYDLINQYKTVGTSVALIDKDDNVHYITTGYANLEKNIKTKKENLYRIASISKVIVAIGLLKLYDKGIVDLDKDISFYLGYKVQNKKYPNDIITLRQVMSQSASLRDSLGYDESNSTDDYIPLQDILQEKNGYACFSENKPGKVFEYSNLGCGVLACVIEKITNKKFIDYIREEVLLPLEIYSGFRLENLKYPENLVGHYLYNKKDDNFRLYRDYSLFKKVQCIDYPLGDNYRGVAGGLYITSVDLCKIMIMLKNKGIYKNTRILKEETVIEMEKVQWKPTEKSDMTDPTYKQKGLQMIIMDDFTTEPLHGHFGNAYGLRSFMLYNQKGGMIFLCNGANFITNEEHMTILQKNVISFLTKKMNL